jgi:predicted transcriptional regulator YdeE
MENQIIEKDIAVLYVTAETYPHGILGAHEKLQQDIPFSQERKFYGLSRPEDGLGIVYKAAAEVKTADEPEKFKLETMIIPSGKYISQTIRNFREDLPLIEKTFRKLLDQPNIDPNGYCVEWYLPNGRDVACMVRVTK